MTSKFLPLFLTAVALLPGASASQATLEKATPGQRLLLKGDSIAKGYGFGNYTDPSPLRSVYGIVNILLQENQPLAPRMSPMRLVWKEPTPGEKPALVDSLSAEVKVYLETGEMRAGDWFIYEDAGPVSFAVNPQWPSDKDMYRRYREGLRGMVEAAEAVINRPRIRLMTMFDYSPKVPWSEWDAPLDDGIHSANDAVRDEAAALGVAYIDMNRIMDRAQAHVVSWGSVCGPDGIHPNVYGNYVMALAILHSLGADIGRWKLEKLAPRFHRPATGGDVPLIWGFTTDPTDAERVRLLHELKGIVVDEAARPARKPSLKQS